MDKYITQYQAAIVIGISRSRLNKLIKQDRFIKGKLKFSKHAGKNVIHYKTKDVIEFTNNRK